MNAQKERKHISSKEIGDILSDQLYENIRIIGINGGEPFIRNDLYECVSEMVDKLPNLCRLNIISNGYFTEKILSDLQKIKAVFGKKLYIDLSISIDGVGKLQDVHRGAEGAFTHAMNTIHCILRDKYKYVDELEIICTITKINIWAINEVEVLTTNLGISTNYNIASLNKRIENHKKANEFLVETDEMTRHMAAEFFYGQYIKTSKESYYAIYLYLLSGKRFALCPHKRYEWTTILPNGNIEFCATQSKDLENGLKYKPIEILKKSICYFESMSKKNCDTCPHYMYLLNGEGLKYLYEDRIKNQNIRYIGSKNGF